MDGDAVAVDVADDGDVVAVDGDVVAVDGDAVEIDGDVVDGDTVDVPGMPVLEHAAIHSTIATVITIIDIFFILVIPPKFILIRMY